MKSCARPITRHSAVKVFADSDQDTANIVERHAQQECELDGLAGRALRRWENEGGHL
jgi:hypothetical protein